MAEAPEFSRPIRLDTLGDGARDVTVEANVDERVALARRFNLRAIERLRATVALVREGSVVRCEGRLESSVTQACVASGDPVPATVDEPFALRFVPEGKGEADEEVELAAEDLDEVAYSGSAIDVGEAVAQTLALSLDPFPRAAGAEAALRAAGVVDEEAVGPFAALKALRDGR